MTGALLRKEAKEHGWVFLSVLLLSAGGLAFFLKLSDLEGGRFAPLERFSLTYLVVEALVASNRLVVREYGGRTQLFLETLPLSRLRVLATKWLLGLAWLLTLALGAWLTTLYVQRRSEVISGRDAWWALERSGAFAVALWSFCFLTGLLGRFRYTAWMTLAVFFYSADRLAEVPTWELPFFRMMNETFSLSRSPPLPADLVVSLGVVLVCVAGSLGLALIGEGAIAATLSQKMTSRERVFVGCSMVTVMFLVEVLSSRKTVPPFQLKSAVHRDTAGGEVGVMPTAEVSTAAAASLAERLAHDREALASDLHLPALPGVFVMPRRGLDPSLFVRASLKDRDGVVVQAAVGAPGFEEEKLRAHLVHEVLRDRTRSRALKEDRHWFLDGFALWWVARGRRDLQDRYWLRAAASPLSVTPEVLAHWSQSHETLGECVGEALAFAAVSTLATRWGDATVFAVATPLFTQPPADARAFLGEESLTHLLAAQGVALADLAAASEQARLAVGSEQAARLGQRHAGMPTVSFERMAGRQSRVVVTQPAGAPPPDWHALYTELGPWQRETPIADLARVDSQVSHLTLPITASAGQVLLVATEATDPILGCQVRSLALRQEVP